MKKSFFTIVLVVYNLCTLNAQVKSKFRHINPIDTASFIKPHFNFEIPLALIAGGMLSYGFDRNFRGMKDFYFPTFKQSYDDYTQYLPAAVMFGLKSCGVESRSSWKEMLLSDAISVSIMASLVNGLKYTIKKERPDGSSKKSFPSGHTATAFMTATMLHKEYGHKSPWISVGAYSCATLTGFTRQLNTRHWMSDVIVGAGIGILSVELAYLLSDLILNGKKKKNYSNYDSSCKNENLSFLGMQIGVKNYLTEFRLQDNKELSIDYSSSIGIEGAWYCYKNLGIGGQMNLSSHLYDIDGEKQTVPFGTLSISTGPYYSIPISKRFRCENKALLGLSFIQRNNFTHKYVDICNNLNYTLGTSISYITNSDLAFKIFGEYKLIPNFINRKNGQELSMGLSLDYHF